MSLDTFTDNSLSTLRSYVQRAGEPEWLRALRSEALQRFEQLPWPTTSDEEFRRSSLSDYAFESYPLETSAALPAAVENPVGLSGHIVFEGPRAVRFSLAEGLAERGVVLTSISNAASLDPKVAAAVERTMRGGLSTADNRLSVWHYAAMTHGAVLYVPRFVELSEPFVFTFEEAGQDTVLRAPHVVVVAEEGARFTVVHRAHQAPEGELLFNEGTSYWVGDGAEVKSFGLQTVNLDSSYVANSYATVQRDAAFKHYVAPFGGMFAKYRTDVTMDGPGSDAFLGGVYFPHQDQHIDLRTVQHHEAGKAHSLTLYKGAIADEAHSIYQGLISVARTALGTDAYLNNKNILLSDEARSDSIPTLNINTDEVRCSHGSTTGKLDARQLYYLETRGYPTEEARRLLIEGFLEEVVAAYPSAVLDEIHAVIAERIGACEHGCD